MVDESKEYLLADMMSRKQPFSNRAIVAKLSPDEAKVLLRNIEGEVYDLSNKGFIDPSKITKYHCDCGEHEGAPKLLVRVTKSILDPDVQTAYRCRECDSFVYISNSSPDPKNVDPKFITFDETGDFVKPTPDSIEQHLQKALDSAREGHGDGIKIKDFSFYKKDLEYAWKWAKKTGYEIPRSRIREIRRAYQGAHLKNFTENLPQLIDELLKKKDCFSLWESEGHEDMSIWEGIGMYEKFGPLLETLPHIKLPDDPVLKRKIYDVMMLYKGMFDEEANRPEREAKALLEKAVKQRKDNLVLEGEIQSLLKQANITTKDLERAESMKKPV